LNGWGQTEADFAFFDLAQDKVELKSDGWRTEKIADDPNVYELWYFDIQNHDGAKLGRYRRSQVRFYRVYRHQKRVTGENPLQSESEESITAAYVRRFNAN
jgi:hypothetical protein